MCSRPPTPRARARAGFARRRELREELLARVKADALDADTQRRLSAEMSAVGLRKEAKFVRNCRVRRAAAPAMSSLSPQQLKEKADAEAAWARAKTRVETSRLRKVADRVCNTKHAALTRARLLQDLDALLSIECLLSNGFRCARRAARAPRSLDARASARRFSGWEFDDDAGRCGAPRNLRSFPPSPLLPLSPSSRVLSLYTLGTRRRRSCTCRCRASCSTPRRSAGSRAAPSTSSSRAAARSTAHGAG